MEVRPSKASTGERGLALKQRRAEAVGDSGIIDWQRLDRTITWIKDRQCQATFVYAFWLFDYGRNARDHGVSLLKAEDKHPDWFVHAETADKILDAHTSPKSSISPNFLSVFPDALSSRPLLGSLLLGSNDSCYKRQDEMWWACESDLTRGGRSLLKKLDHLYERRHILVTFVESPTDEASGPRDPAS